MYTGKVMLERIRRQRRRRSMLSKTLLRLEQSTRGFLLLAELIDDPELVAFSKKTAAERRSMANQLLKLRDQHPILEIEPRVDVVGTVHRAWMKSNVGRDAEALVAEALRGELRLADTITTTNTGRVVNWQQGALRHYLATSQQTVANTTKQLQAAKDRIGERMS